MSQYKISIHAAWQIGVLFEVTNYSVIVNLPFVEMHFATTKDACGYRIFGKDYGL